MNARRLIPATLTTLCAITGILLFAGASAQAAGVRGEEGSFGPKGLGSGVFEEPQSIAVEQGSGDVFVYDVGEGGRIYKFNAAGKKVDFSSTSTNVIEGVGGGVGEGEIAVDNSSGPDKGDIYVATGSRVLVYSSTGAALATFAEAGHPYGVAVDPSGALYVAFNGEKVVRKYVPVSNPVTSADYTEALWEVEKAGNIAVDSAGDVYVAEALGGGVTKYDESQFSALDVTAIGTAFDANGASSLAVDPSSGGNVFIDEGSDVAEYTPSDTRLASFAKLSESRGIAVDHTSGEVYVAEEGEASEVVIFGPEVPVVTYTVTVLLAGSGSGYVNPSSGSEIKECAITGGVVSGVCSGSYKEGAGFIVTAFPAAHNTITWSGCSLVSGPGCYLLDIASDITVTATFTPAVTNYTLGVDTSGGTGSGAVECEVEGGAAKACAPEYPEGTEFTLVPVAGSGSEFAGFSGGSGSAVDCSGVSPCTFKLEADSSLDAPFNLEAGQRSLAVDTSGGSGSGEVRCDGGVCASSYPAGETVTLTDVAGAHSSFVGWSVTGSGATITPCTGVVSPCEVEMENDVTVDAPFDLNTHTLAVTPAGSGSGSVSASTGEVKDCAIAGGVVSGTCSGGYDEGATVTLTASPATKNKVEWSGCKSSSGDTCSVEISAADASVTATFTAQTGGAGGVRTEIGSFGPGGPGSGVFSKPQSIAVEQGTENVYVYDIGEGGRIYKFNAAGEPRDFSGLEATAHPNVIEGVGGRGGEEGEIAVDSSSGPDEGDIYVATGEKVLIYSSTGAKLATFTGAGNPLGVAVDPSGVLYVSFDSNAAYVVKKYTPVTNPVTTADYTSSLWEVEATNIAVDFAGDVYAVNYENESVIKYEASQFSALNPEEVPAIGTEIDSYGTALAVDPSSGGDVYIDEEEDIAEYKSSGERVESFGELQESSGVAVSHKSEDVYASDGEGSEVVIFGRGAVLPEVSVAPVSERHERSVTLNGAVNPEETDITACEFEYGTTTSYGHSEACSPPAPFSGNSPVTVSASVDGLELDTTYYFRLTATNADGTRESAGSFTTAGARIDGEAAGNVASSSVDLQAQIAPNGSDTSYYFQYGLTSGYGTSVPAPPGVDIGSGEAEQSVVQHVQGLAQGTTYHYRVVAVEGSDGSEELFGPDQTFTTPVAGEELALLDGREWEMVSPLDKHGTRILPIVGGLVQAAEDGSAVTYLTDGPIEAEPAGNATKSQVLSTRGPSGWSSKDIEIPHQAATEEPEGKGYDYKFFSSDLSRGLLEPFGPATPLVPEVVGHTLYVRGSASGEFVALVNNGNVPPGSEGYGGNREEVGGGPQFEGATPDLSHVVLGAKLGGVSGLYEWTSGALELVSILPDGEPVEGTLGKGRHQYNPRSTRNAVSSDGSRVVFTAEKAGAHLFLRDTVKGETLQIDTVQGGSGAGTAEPLFQTASNDGSRVFFTDAQRLTADASTAEGSVDLYACDVVEEAGKLACRLSDLTPDPGESPGLLGGPDTVLGASEDGSYVYFVADGALTPDATVGNCTQELNPQGNTCNLYVAHDEAGVWSMRLIAVLSGTDEPDWGRDLTELTARVSPNGQWLAFMSNRSLTGYDNRDLNSGEPDEELFLYDAVSERLICASCDPSGGRPVGVDENLKMLVSGLDVFNGKWVAALVPGWMPDTLNESHYQGRYLSDSGRLFFDSPDALVPQDVNGTWDVYEYEPDEVGSCARAWGCVGLISGGASAEESAFLDASASGDDVFFLTSAQLTTGDLDTAYDVYDAHVCSASSPCLASPASPPACETADSCRAASASQPSIFGAPPSATFSGQGNAAAGSATVKAATKEKAKSLTRAQKLTRALKACRRQPKRRRAKCERRARKRYGAKAKRGSRGKAREGSGGHGKVGR